MIAMPAALKPERARPPASVKVRRCGPSSRRIDSTTAVSTHSAFQSQFCAWMTRPLCVASGSATTPVHPSASSVSAFAARLAPSLRISVRALRSTMSSNATPAPSAIPRISSMYARSKRWMCGRYSSTAPRIAARSKAMRESCPA